MIYKEMTIEECGKFLRNMAELTATASKNWDNYQNLATDLVRCIYEAGRKAGLEPGKPTSDSNPWSGMAG